eukprot:Nitzschia sp. Nitz4//scaffold66_size103028//18407//19408//NITZ4_004491-RA/size103028-processed-gene-0.2-mRNA-1//1//CDS//3329556329//2434//frame0
MNIGNNLHHLDHLGANFSNNFPVVGDVVERVDNVSGQVGDDSTAPTSINKPHLSAVKPLPKGETVAAKLEEKKRRRKKKWKKPKDKPTRPLSAYNLFFQAERSLMLGDDAPSEELENLKKRVHCKTHGKIGFAEMARAIGAKWKTLESEKRKRFEDEARKEKDRYLVELAAWKEAQKEKNTPAPADLNKGLDTMAAAAAVTMPSTMNEPDQMGGMGPMQDGNMALRMSMADGINRRNMQMFQQRPQNNFDYFRALQDHQLNLSNFNNSLAQYPSAAEASASALLQHFQGGNQGNQQQSNQGLGPLPFQTNPQLAATMRQLQFMSNGRFGNPNR